jgi:hypothetical protein
MRRAQVVADVTSLQPNTRPVAPLPATVEIVKLVWHGAAAE